ncbi:MAG: hypothetical protein FJW54_00930 [Actinobacteria bacterium]|nr:hypothetical protein [Actinomycetota bacterium]
MAQRTVLPPKIVDIAEDLMHALLGVGVFIVALISTYQGVIRLIEAERIYPEGAIRGINDLLFVIILLEILRTVIGRFTNGSYQLESFLIIGVIASVRSILTVGATLTLGSDISQEKFTRLLYELGISAIISLLLVVALAIAKFSRRSFDPMEQG